MSPDEFEQFYAVLPEPMLLVSFGGEVLAANNGALALVGVPLNKAIGKPLELLTEETAERVHRLLRLFQRSAQFLPGSLSFTRGASPSVRCRVEGAAFRSNSGAALILRLQRTEFAITRFRALNDRITALHREILERKRVEEMLFAQRELLRITLASIGDGVITTDDCGLVTFINPVAEALTGWRNQEAAGRPLRDIFRIISEETRGIVENPVAEVQRRGAIVGLANHTLLIAKDGAERAIADSGAPIFDLQGRMVGVVLVFRDVTEQRRSERELEETNRSLEKRNDNLHQFAYAVAHDLREPMRIVNLYSQLLQRRYHDVLSGDGEMYLHQTAGGARRMEELLEGLLAFMTIEEPGLADWEDVDCGKLVAETAANLETLIREAGAGVSWSELPVLKGHYQSYITLFQNLIGNGIKYRRAGVPPSVRISADRGLREWKISVEDNGIGIEPEYHSRIFGVFKRLHPEKYPGTGIGLALCSKVVEIRGGSISVESTPGEGSRFIVTIPDC